MHLIRFRCEAVAHRWWSKLDITNVGSRLSGQEIKRSRTKLKIPEAKTPRSKFCKTTSTYPQLPCKEKYNNESIYVPDSDHFDNDDKWLGCGWTSRTYAIKRSVKDARSSEINWYMSYFCNFNLEIRISLFRAKGIHFYLQIIFPVWKYLKCLCFVASFNKLFCDVSEGFFMMHIYA